MGLDKMNMSKFFCGETCTFSYEKWVLDINNMRGILDMTIGLNKMVSKSKIFREISDLSGWIERTLIIILTGYILNKLNLPSSRLYVIYSNKNLLRSKKYLT